MLRSLLRFLSPGRQAPSPITRIGSETVVLYAELPVPSSRPKSAAKTIPATAPESVCHRQRVLTMKLEHTRLCSPGRCGRLKDLGIDTAGELATADIKSLAESFGSPRKAAAILKRYRRAIRLAAAVPGLTHRDALLLVSVHRRSIRGLALESPAALHRDLQRFAESTTGRRQLRGRRLPSVRRIKRWIAASESLAREAATPLHVA
jgi:hypothetical protein